MLYDCCRCHPYMYLFHQWHYSCLTFAVSDQRNILKDVTNRNGIKAATIKFFFIPAVLNYPRKTWCVQYRKWSPTANDPETANDPQNGPQMILNRKWSSKSIANDPERKIGLKFVDHCVNFIIIITKSHIKSEILLPK